MAREHGPTHKPPELGRGLAGHSSWPRLLSRSSAHPQGGSNLPDSRGNPALHRGRRPGKILHIEGAEAIDPDLKALDVLHQAGLRSIGPYGAGRTSSATACRSGFRVARHRPRPHRSRQGAGTRCNGSASCSTCRTSTRRASGTWRRSPTRPGGHPLQRPRALPTSRNLTDKQLDAITEFDGMVGVNFNVRDLRADGSAITDTPLTVVRHVDYLVTHRHRPGGLRLRLRRRR